MAADRGGHRGNFGNQNANSSTNNPIPPHKRTTTSDPVGHPNKRSTGDAAPSTGPFYMRALSKMPEPMQKEQHELLTRINACTHIVPILYQGSHA
ncbi:hypothetical protein F5051DRAFT_447227 [Lentinula edodes]|nr:hypothetical protein F5051DRAFT_447227 [Lentinula edodes]